MAHQSTALHRTAPRCSAHHVEDRGLGRELPPDVDALPLAARDPAPLDRADELVLHAAQLEHRQHVVDDGQLLAQRLGRREAQARGVDEVLADGSAIILYIFWVVVGN